ncbi:hypothetical protein FP435_08035 [Lactobacillus sp. PV037]|uniref:hypothetical protein n=1 Tax=unclassified Lactobacillus TaxID=2620435 RepID=UPI0022406441|nr:MULTISPECIES: hypothetical protein [unclassified Lactobacillus]QNQ81585.1 hypothetical protein FP433_00220 [Lactobacillus sp. PV012]QNQ84368.1 hypothetical protein FP435_08035 [Lactobacillus sp. PV037]
MTKYIADIKPLNEDKIGSVSHGTAEFTETDNTLHIHVEMFDTPKNIEHWEHFHGFPDGKDASVPTSAADTNHDGYIDLPETEPFSGTTMVPLDNAPHKMNIPHDGYPVADENGHYEYEVDVPLSELKVSFKKAFNTDNLDLDKRVVYVHGVPESMPLPDTVKGTVMSYDPHTTLPIAAGKIRKVED